MALTAYADAYHAVVRTLAKYIWTVHSSLVINTMADAEHAPTMAPPVRTDEQILYPTHLLGANWEKQLLSELRKISTHPNFQDWLWTFSANKLL
ncbi:hypothetical protein Tco_1399944 [Tanacetum coccineum]